MALLAAGRLGASPLASAGGADWYPEPQFPHKAVYLQLSSDGFQINSDSMVQKIARYDVAVIPASPATETFANRLAQIRRLNPKITLLAYFPADFIWDGSLYPQGNIYGDCWRMFQANDWWLYGTSGQPFTMFGPTFDLSRAVARNGLANFLYNRVLATGLWDGLFLDDFCEDEYWKESYAGQGIDENRDGVRDDPAVFGPIWKTATDSLAQALRDLVDPSMILVGNCAYGSKWSTMNGWMREDFPFQGSWSSNMFSSAGGYMVNEKNFIAPRYDFVYSTSLAPPSQYSSTNLKFFRYCLGSTLLGDGYFMFDDRNPQEIVADYWYDEYDGAGRGTGYLGAPLSPYAQTVGALTTPDLLVNSGFESGFANWQSYNLSGSNVLDPLAPPQGTVDVHAKIPTATLYQSQVHMMQTVQLGWGTYSITFWARAATPRTIWAMAQQVSSPNTIFLNVPINIGTTWKLYQGTFFNTVNNNSINFSINMGQQTGDVWLDDVKVQTGASAIYRRDFQNGIVLVNNTSITIPYPLERGYYTLSGKQDPTINTGQLVTQVTLAGNDAIILVNTSPAAVDVGAALRSQVQLTTDRSPAMCAAQFSLRLARGADVDLDLFEASGRRVAQLSRGPLAAGTHHFQWQGRVTGGHNAGVGVYFARARVQIAGATQMVSARVVLLH